MVQLQTNEIINIIFDLISIPILVMVFKDKSLPRYYWFFLAFSFLIASHTATILESFVIPDILNFIEHLCLLLSSLAFLTGIITFNAKKPPT